jgi:nicotinate-nucleotide adenylyltransferase
LKRKQALRIGIFAGAFDPVHAGHLAYALQAMEAGQLDEVVFLPERRPRHKPGVEHYAHRVAMLKRATQPHPQFSVLELVDRYFTVSRTLPQLLKLFKGHQLVFMVGSDVVPHLASWPHSRLLLKSCELLIGIRSEHKQSQILEEIGSWSAQPQDVILVDSFAADISSSRIRDALRADHDTKGMLTSVRRYARREWLYVSPGSLN